MFAVIRTGGKQHRVSENDRIVVERLAGQPGDVIELDDVVMLSEDGKPPLVGVDTLGGAKVFAEVVAQQRGQKILVFKKKRRKNYRRMRGHRQHQTVLRIARISPTGERPELAPSAEPIPTSTAALDTDAAVEPRDAAVETPRLDAPPEATATPTEPESKE